VIDFGLPGLRVGHWSDDVARTGCTVLLFPEGTVASGEVRGGAPATRDFSLLDPSRTVARLDALVLTGGSAFGLAAADGVMDFCEEHDVGVPTRAGKVPIVVAMALFDLSEGDRLVRPGAAQGLAAARAASEGPVALGRIGAGTGATTAKWLGPDHARPGGLGGAVVRRGELVVGALVAVNASGAIDDGGVASAVTEGTFEGWPADQENPFTNTTIGAVVTNARLDKVGCHLVSQGAHDGYARALFPAHTRGDGDAVVTAALGLVDGSVDVIRLLAVVAVEKAVRSVAWTGAPLGRDLLGDADA
jgi:L-aminopeptidase/D-esterase-like protein